MEIKRLRKGQREVLPLHFLRKGSGWSSPEAPEDGLKIGLDASEWMPGGIFLTDSQLREVGYTRAKPLKLKAKKLAAALLKNELEWLAEKLGLPLTGTKLQLAQRILDGA